MQLSRASIPWKKWTGLPTIHRIAQGAPVSRSNLILIIAIIYITTFALDSPLRYALNLIHCAALMYLRDASIAVLIFLELLCAARLRRIHKGIFIVLIVIFLHLIIGFLVSRNAPQTLFGFKIFLPFIGGILAAIHLSLGQKNTLAKAFALLWITTVTGLFLEKFGVHFPWAGFSFGIGDIQIEGNRSWTAVGIFRLSGFTRASFDAAIIVSTLPFFFMYSSRRFIRVTVIILSLIAIALTITKGVLLGFFVVSVVAVILEFRFPFRKIVIIAALIMGGALMIGLPLYFDGITFHTDRTDLVQEFLLGSFRERINWTWPDAWSYIADPITYIMGVGIGGIGVAQSYFSDGNFQPGDNMLVYLRVVFGIPAYMYLAYAFKKGINYSAYAKSGALLLAMYFIFGISMSVIESATGAFTLGYILSPYTNQLACSFLKKSKVTAL